jgi:hypothetical protein
MRKELEMKKEVYMVLLRTSLPNLVELEEYIKKIIDRGEESHFWREFINNILYEFGKKLIRENIHDPRIEEVWFFQRWIWVIQ